MPKSIALLLSSLSLISCSAAPVDVVCPSLPAYSPEVQIQAADELDAMPPGSVIANVFMPDYGQLRDGVRACLQARGAK